MRSRGRLAREERTRLQTCCRRPSAVGCGIRQPALQFPGRHARGVPRAVGGVACRLTGCWAMGEAHCAHSTRRTIGLTREHQESRLDICAPPQLDSSQMLARDKLGAPYASERRPAAASGPHAHAEASCALAAPRAPADFAQGKRCVRGEVGNMVDIPDIMVMRTWSLCDM